MIGFEFTKTNVLQPPIPIKPWFGIRNAQKMGQHCVQGGSQSHISTEWPIDIEDCLNMNIYTPARPSNQRSNLVDLPVLVYIHGGSFSTGRNAEHPASYILEHNNILVVPNYRLDALGKRKQCKFSHQSCDFDHFFFCLHLFCHKVFYQQKPLKFPAMLVCLTCYRHWNG